LPSRGQEVLWKAREAVFHADEGEWQLSQAAPRAPRCGSLWQDAQDAGSPL